MINSNNVKDTLDYSRTDSIFALGRTDYYPKALCSGTSNTRLEVEAKPYGQGAFLLVKKQTVIAETHAAERAIELLTMKNFVPAFAAFDSSIDQLKHPMFIPKILVINTSGCRQR
jgi:hypothetical protein